MSTAIDRSRVRHGDEPAVPAELADEIVGEARSRAGLLLLLDYDATLANRELLNLQTNLGSYLDGPLPPTKAFTTDVLLTYLLHPGTALYVGYTNGLSNLSLDQSLPTPSVFYQASPSNRNSQLVFVKFSYLFRF